MLSPLGTIWTFIKRMKHCPTVKLYTWLCPDKLTPSSFPSYGNWYMYMKYTSIYKKNGIQLFYQLIAEPTVFRNDFIHS